MESAYVSGHGRLDNPDLPHVYGASKSVGQYTSGSEFMTPAALTVAVQVPHRDCGSDCISWSVSTSAISEMDKRRARYQISLLSTVR
jgi:hypothetical protein